MKLSLNGIKDNTAWEAAGIALPGYDGMRFQKTQEPRLGGYTSVSEISFVFSSAGSPTACWKAEI